MAATTPASAFDERAFQDPTLAKGLIDAIHKWAPEHATLMEVCGTHTASIGREGIRNVMPAGVRLASGPGCPVCVTCNRDIDTVIALARVPGIIITTFGDMTRVPGSTSSLLGEQAKGADVRICYSPLDSLRIARENPDRQVVFVGVGFETTTPAIAASIQRAKKDGLKVGLRGLTALSLKLGAGLDDLHVKCERVEKALAKRSPAAIIAAMDDLRRTVDRLEHLVDDSRWPLPKYREMLFVY
jgi:hydrogenase maturation factor